MQVREIASLASDFDQFCRHLASVQSGIACAPRLLNDDSLLSFATRRRAARAILILFLSLLLKEAHEFDSICAPPQSTSDHRPSTIHRQSSWQCMAQMNWACKTTRNGTNLGAQAAKVQRSLVTQQTNAPLAKAKRKFPMATTWRRACAKSNLRPLALATSQPASQLASLGLDGLAQCPVELEIIINESWLIPLFVALAFVLLVANRRVGF